MHPYPYDMSNVLLFDKFNIGHEQGCAMCPKCVSGYGFCNFILSPVKLESCFIMLDYMLLQCGFYMVAVHV